MNWSNVTNWKKASRNTLWCLLGCAIGDFGTILFFQIYYPATPVMLVMTLAILNGLATSILLETIILKIKDNFDWIAALKVAIGMSLISMISMEVAMNVVDVALTGGARLVWWVIPIMLIAGFITPLPYNYWRLEKHGKCCH
jgi:hypothetical protein